MKQVKIPFSLPEYEKGTYKVETRDGRSVRILCTNAKGDDPVCDKWKMGCGVPSNYNCINKK